MKKVNLIDVAMVVLILALLVGVFLKFGVYSHTKVDTEMKTINYTIKVSGIRNYTVDALSIGDIVYDTQTKVIIGTITDIKWEKSKVYRETDDGRVVCVEDTDRYDLYLTIQTDGMETDKAYFADRSVELKVGSDKTFETLYVKTNGIIMDIDVL